MWLSSAPSGPVNTLSFITSGAVGSFFNDVEIDSRHSTATVGLVNSAPPAGVFLTEVVQALYVNETPAIGQVCWIAIGVPA